ncbi:MAG: hypothetical protein OEX00_03585 [Gammaproteobacteria bacterium]|nr:hypothetical protein [Gammaproteobacteria bacterium]MDH5694825.1 hypothetical protein [Gammaproteobacteria bacterium]
MKKVVTLILILLVVWMSGCAVAPFNAPHTARSLGEGKSNINLSVIPRGLEYSTGVDEDIDVGVGVEVHLAPMFTGWMKYSMSNNREGGSTALLGGLFYSDGIYNSTSKGYYFGPILSYRAGSAEWYLATKYNHVYWEAGENQVKDENNDLVFSIDPVSHDFGYFQVNAGLSYWFSDGFNTDLSALCLKMDEQKPACVPMLGFGWSF